jgi:hypothetical protein
MSVGVMKDYKLHETILLPFFVCLLEVYYESIKREPKIRGINKCRCDERLQTKTKEFTRLPYKKSPCLFFYLSKKKTRCYTPLSFVALKQFSLAVQQ